MFFSIDYEVIFLGITLIGVAILALAVFVDNMRSVTSRNYLLLSIFAIIYNLLNYIATRPINVDVAFMFLRLTIFSSIWYSYFLYQLFYIFPHRDKTLPNWFKGVILPITVVASFLTLTPFVFSSFKEISASGVIVDVNYGLMMPLFVFWVFFLVSGSVYFLLQKIKNTVGAEKKALQSVTLGTILTYSAILIFNVIFPYFLKNTQFISLAALFTLPFVIFTAYAILRYKLLNIKIIATELFIFALWIVMVLRTLWFVSWWDTIINIVLLIFLVVIGTFLIKSVIKEVRQKEKLQALTKKIQKTSKELADANKDLELANKDLARLDEAKSEFLSIASHQLRTPTSAIKGYTSMILEGDYGKVTAPVKDAVNKVFLSSERLINLIESLLNISRIEAGRIEFNMEAVAMKKVVADVVESFQKKAKDKKLKLEYVPDKKIPKVSADPDKVVEVISNVIDNAIKYTLKGSITVSLHAEGQSVVFTSQDTGVGMDAEDVSRLFNKFVRGKGSSTINTEGTGLGLYFARRVAENMGGRIWAESPGKGQGSKFSFSLPMADKSKAGRVG